MVRFMTASDISETASSAVQRSLLLDLLSSAPIADVESDTAIALVQQCEALISWLTVRQHEALTVAAGSLPRELEYLAEGSPHTITDVMREEIALAMRWSFGYAQSRIDTARNLLNTLPQTCRLLEEGRITVAHANVIARSAESLPEDRLHEFESRVLPTAEGQTVARTRQHANRVADSLQEQDVQERRDAACRREAGVWVYPEQDGLATLLARMPLVDALAISSAIEQSLPSDQLLTRAHAMSDEHDSIAERPIGMRRAAALRDLVLGTNLPGGVHAVIDVVIDMNALLGFTDAEAEVNGVGHVSPDVVRALIADDPDATLRKLLTDPVTGHLEGVGTNRYRVTGRFREFLLLRDRRCRFPGCRRKASRCEIDHSIPWNEGGLSTRENLGALCKRHHQLKTHAGWRISESQPSGACAWVSPEGREYRHAAVPVLQSSA